MSRKYNRKGFTLIEILVVIAIIAVLVAIVVPAVSNSAKKAQAAADALNLHTIHALLNAEVVSGNRSVEEIIAGAEHPVSKYDSDAVLCAVYDAPGFIDVYYVNQSTSKYYGLDYLSDVATNGTSSLSTAQPSVPSGSVWYTVQGESITD